MGRPRRVTLVTGADYAVRAVRLRRRRRAAPEPAGPAGDRDGRAVPPGAAAGGLARRDRGGCWRAAADARRRRVAHRRPARRGDHHRPRRLRGLPRRHRRLRHRPQGRLLGVPAALLAATERFTPTWRGDGRAGCAGGWAPRSGWRPPGWPGRIRRTGSRWAPCTSRRPARAAPADWRVSARPLALSGTGRDPAGHCERSRWGGCGACCGKRAYDYSVTSSANTARMRSPGLSVRPGTVDAKENGRGRECDDGPASSLAR